MPDAPDDLKICLRCGRKTGFDPDPYNGEWVSQCCGWPAVAPDREPA